MIFLSNIPDKMRYIIYLTITDFFKNFLGEIRLVDLRKQIKSKLNDNEEFQKMIIDLKNDLIHELLRKSERTDSSIGTALEREKIEEKIKNDLNEALFNIFITSLNNLAITGEISIHKIDDSLFIEKNISRSGAYNLNESLNTESKAIRNNANEDNSLNHAEVAKKIIDVLSSGSLYTKDKLLEELEKYFSISKLQLGLIISKLKRKGLLDSERGWEGSIIKLITPKPEEGQTIDEGHEARETERTENRGHDKQIESLSKKNLIQESIIRILSGPWGTDGFINIYILFKVLESYDYDEKMSLKQFSGPKDFKFIGLLKELEIRGLIDLQGDLITIKNIN